MRHVSRPALPCAVAAAVLAAACTAAAAPLNPELLRTGDPSLLARIPAEPSLEIPGVLHAAAMRGGRHWTGHPRILAILVDFEDHTADDGSRTPEDIERLLFSRGEMTTPSLRDYYQEVSGGRLDVTGEVVGWYRMPLSRAAYVDGSSGLGADYPRNARGLAADAVRAALDAGIDLHRFDNDGPDNVPGSGDDDGILDALIVIQAGRGAERTGSPNDFRSHVLTMTAMSEAQGLGIPDYVVIPSEENVGVPVHEFGHILGGEDLYDTTGRAWGLGYFSVMAYNMWLVNGTRPGGPDPYTRLQWGLASVDVLGADEPDIDIPAINETPYVLRLWTLGETGREYFLVENRRPVGVDALLPGDGLLVYHVDENVSRQDSHSRYRVALVQADGLRSLEVEDKPYNGGEAGDYFPGKLDVRRWGDDTLPSSRSNHGDATRVTLRVLDDSGPVIRVAAEVGRRVAGGPAPHLVLEPVDGYLGQRAVPGVAVPLRVVLVNYGTRLRAGTLSFTTRDPRITVSNAGSVPVSSVGSLGRLSLPEPLLVTVAPDAGPPALIEASWEGEEGTWSLAARVPREHDVVLRDGFEDSDETVTTRSLADGKPAWTWVTGFSHQGAHAWGAGGRSGYPERMDALLELPPATVGPGAVLHFAHLLLTSPPTGTAAFDGGFLEISLDGGSNWDVADPEGGYPTRFVLTSGNSYPGFPAWAAFDNEWREETVLLRAGENRIRFHWVSDYSASPGKDMGWFVDDVVIEDPHGSHAAVLEVAGIDGGDVRLSYRITPMVSPAVPTPVRLIQEGPEETLILGDWLVDEDRGGTFTARGLRPGNRYRFRMEFPYGAIPDRVVTIPAAGQDVFRAPAMVRRGDGAWIEYRATAAGPLTLDVFDVSGRLAARWLDGPSPEGWHRLLWPGRTGAGHVLAPGVYFLRLHTETYEETRRVVLLP